MEINIKKYLIIGMSGFKKGVEIMLKVIKESYTDDNGIEYTLNEMEKEYYKRCKLDSNFAEEYPTFKDFYNFMTGGSFVKNEVKQVKTATVAEIRKFAMQYYNKGGDSIVECWDDKDIQEVIDNCKENKKDIYNQFKNIFNGQASWESEERAAEDMFPDSKDMTGTSSYDFDDEIVEESVINIDNMKNADPRYKTPTFLARKDKYYKLADKLNMPVLRIDNYCSTLGYRDFMEFCEELEYCETEEDFKLYKDLVMDAANQIQENYSPLFDDSGYEPSYDELVPDLGDDKDILLDSFNTKTFDNFRKIIAKMYAHKLSQQNYEILLDTGYGGQGNKLLNNIATIYFNYIDGASMEEINLSKDLIIEDIEEAINQ